MAKKVLCIDDSPTIRKLVKKSLEPEGYEVLEAGDGSEGLSVSKGASVDLFIVDVNMPVMDGFSFVKNIKEEPGYKKTPIIFLTTESSADKKLAGKDLGVSGWIVKPFETASFIKVVAMLTG